MRKQKRLFSTPKIKQQQTNLWHLKYTLQAVMIFMGVPLLLLIICAIFYFFGRFQEAKAMTLVVQQAIYEQCNLESYNAEARYYDLYPRTIYYHKLDSNVTIYCDFSSVVWECTCNS